jgi:geranylgeranyl diphosphate synthase type II
LFIAATSGSALSAGADPVEWERLGDLIGQAYQVADDLLDAVASMREVGKPTGRDAALSRPSAVAAHGVDGATARLRLLLSDASDAVPPCERPGEVRSFVARIAGRFNIPGLKRSAA